MKHLTPHEVALKRLNLKRGDKVKIISKSLSYERGWGDAWLEEMDEYVGTIGTVQIVGDSDGVLKSSGGVFLREGFWFPAFCLEKVREVDR